MRVRAKVGSAGATPQGAVKSLAAGDRSIGRTRSFAALAVAVLFSIFTPTASADVVIGELGSGAGQYHTPEGIAVDSSNGTLYVSDYGNHRIDAFEPDGDFLRAFGWGAVASGPGNKPQNETEQVKVEATGGKFNLRFVQYAIKPTGPFSEETPPISFDASPATVQAALESLEAFDPGDVTVTGPAGGPWTLAFAGRYADMDVPNLRADSSGLTGGAQKVSVTTTQVGANYEVCVPANGDICREGQIGAMSGQLSPKGIAVDPTSHDVYVFDGDILPGGVPSARVQKFTATGERLYMVGSGVNKTTGADLCTAASGNTCGTGLPDGGEGQYDRPIRVNPGGVLYLAGENRVKKYTSAGADAGQLILPPGDLSQTYDLEVSSTGDIYTIGPGAKGAVRRYDAAGNLLSTFQHSFNLHALSLDSSDTLFVNDGDESHGTREYDSSNTLLSVFYGSHASTTAIAAYHSAAGDIFAVETQFFGPQESGVVYIKHPPPGPAVLKEKASTIRSVSATLNAKVNPENKATTYHFEYVDQVHFENGGFSNPATQSTPESAAVGPDFAVHAASAAITGLTPETTYHFRAIATNADGSGIGPEETFTTNAPMALGATWATEVGIDGVTLNAEVDPRGLAGTGYFQYVDNASFEADEFANAVEVPDVDGGQSPIDLGSGEGFKSVSAQVYPLEAATRYRYRFVGSNAFGTFIGSTHSFNTFRSGVPGEEGCSNQEFRTGISGALPDCRAYEMVSPLNKENGDIISPTQLTGYLTSFYQASNSGEGLTYSSYRTFGDAQSSPFTSQYVATRGEDGWSSEVISPPQSVTQGAPTVYDNQFLGATAGLSSGWFLGVSDLPLTADAPAGFRNLYRRDNPDGNFEALNTVTPPHPAREFEPELQGVSADGSVAVFAANDNLTPNARPNNINQLYLSTKGSPLRLVSILPDGTVSKESSFAGGNPTSFSTGIEGLRFGRYTHALSEDGSRLFWSTGKVYLRENAGQDQSAIAAGKCTEPAKACTVAVSETASSGAATFLTAAADGSRAIFSLNAGQLYEFDTASQQSAPFGNGELVGASDDATRVYFVSTANLAPGATAGKRNLYLHEAGGATTFVVTLGDQDRGNSQVDLFRRHNSRVSPDGQHVAFMSTAELTGYDNRDAASGAPDAEVYLYEAGGEVICVSCSPSGGRPTGKELTGPVKSRNLEWPQVASFIPSWQTALYAPRALSDDGSRVFFNSFDALSPRDTNGRMDVYEWERPGSGSCTEESQAFSDANGGCLYLISSGESQGDSEFIDAGPSGEDVFFTTGASLLPQDYGLVDIYGAKVGGGFPQPPAPPAACEGEACQGTPEAPNDPTPSSSSFEGAGNVVEGAAPVKAKPSCAKGKVRRKGRCVVKKQRHRAKRAHRRAANDKGRAAR